MKKVIFILLLAPCICKAQMDTTITITDRSFERNKIVQHDIRQYKAIAYTGSILTGVGLISAFIGATSMEKEYKYDENIGVPGIGNDDDPKIDKDRYFLYGGIALSVVGLIFDLASIHHIGKLKMDLKGSSITIPLNK